MIRGFAGLPCGWYGLLPHADLEPGIPSEVPAFGDRLAVWESSEGPRAAVSACPHLGGNLAGGVVKHGRITCPFHGFQFDSSGGNCLIPDSDAVLSRRLVMVPTSVVDGMILGWWHPDGEDPWWTPESLLPDEESRTEVTRVADTLVAPEETSDRCLLPTDLVENLFDLAHFRWVHVNSRMPTASDISFDEHQARITVHQRDSTGVFHMSVVDGLGRSDTRIHPGAGSHFQTAQGINTVIRPETPHRLTAFIGSYAIAARAGDVPGPRAQRDNEWWRTTTLAHGREADGRVIAERRRVPPQWGPHDGPLRDFREWAARFATRDGPEGVHR